MAHPQQDAPFRLKTAKISVPSFAHNNEDRIAPVDLKDLLSKEARRRLLAQSTLGSVLPCACLVLVLFLAQETASLRAHFAYISRGGALHPNNEDRLTPVDVSSLLTLRAKKRVFSTADFGWVALRRARESHRMLYTRFDD
jgi:hypothetical protein